MPTITPVDSVMFINSDTRAFPSRTTNTSSPFAATSSQTPSEQNSWIARKTGAGDHCGDNCRNPNLIQSCCRRGRFHDYQNGWNESTIRSQERTSTQFACPLSEAVHLAMMSGWNPSQLASISSTPYAHADDNKFEQRTVCRSKTPDPLQVPQNDRRN